MILAKLILIPLNMLKSPQFLAKLLLVNRVLLNASWNMQLVIPLGNKPAEKTKPTLKAIVRLRHSRSLELAAPRCSDALFSHYLASSGQTLSQLICTSVQAHGVCMEVKSYPVRCIIPIRANGNEMPKF